MDVYPYVEKEKYAKHLDYNCVQPKPLPSEFSHKTSDCRFLFSNHSTFGLNDRFGCDSHQFRFEAPQSVVCKFQLKYLVHLKIDKNSNK